MRRYSTKRSVPLYRRRIKRDLDFFAKMEKDVNSGLRPKPLAYDMFQWHKPPFTSTVEVKQSTRVQNHIPEDERLRYQYFYHLAKFVPAEHLQLTDDKHKPSTQFIKRTKKFMNVDLMDESSAAQKAFAEVRQKQADLNLQTHIAKQQALLLNLMPYRATTEGGFVTDHDYAPNKNAQKVEPLL